LNEREATKRFYDLVWPQRQVILRTAQILTGSAVEAEDLAQETLLKAFKAIDRFQKGTDARAWLLAILRNARIDRIRAAGSGSHTVSLDNMPVEPAAPSGTAPQDGAWENAEQVLERFSDQQIIDALRKLPDEIRWTLLLVDVEGLDQKEAARILETAVGTIKSRAHRGRAMLREILLPVAREMRLIRDG
jgi:RNA polymerase sigma-70 factor (ECF subfamily)